MLDRNDPCPCGSGKKYKNCCLYKPDNAFEYVYALLPNELYDRAITYLDLVYTSEEYYLLVLEAIKCLIEYINRNVSNKQKVHALMLLSAIYLRLEFTRESDQEESFLEAVKHNIEYATTLFPDSNETNYLNYQYNLYLRNYTEALRALIKVDLNKDSELKWFLRLGINQCNSIHEEVFRFLYDCNFDITEEFLQLLEEAAEKYKYYQDIISEIGELLLENNSPLEAYRILKNALDFVDYKPAVYNLLSLTTNSLGYGDEGIKYGKLGLESLKNLNINGNPALELLKQSLQNNLGLAYIKQRKFREAIDFLEPLVKEQPDDTDLSNLAFACLCVQDYEKAMHYCRQALFLSEDETEYYIYAQSLFYLNKFEEAVLWYKRAIAFLDSDKNKFSYNDNGLTVVSVPLSADEMLADSYYNLIHCYIHLEQYEQASSIYNLAVSRYPTNDKILKLKSLLDAQIRFNETSAKRIQALQNELAEIKKQQENLLNKAKYFASDILKLQNGIQIDVDDLFDDRLDFIEFQNQLHEIALETKNLMTRQSQEAYDRIKREFSVKYSGLNALSIEFLATAEFLYQNNKGVMKDFAPEMVEYCKAVENELNQRIRSRILSITGWPSDERLTLGSFVRAIRDYNIRKYAWLDNALRDVIRYRNGSAHDGFADEKKIESVRKILFGGLLNNLSSL